MVCHVAQRLDNISLFLYVMFVRGSTDILVHVLQVERGGVSISEVRYFYWDRHCVKLMLCKGYMV